MNVPLEMEFAASNAAVDLTHSQRAVVEHRDGPLLVLAGPGSGKTRVVTRRIARLVEQGVTPRNILAITFTNKAAEEMRQRVDALLPGTKIWVSTFHRFCVRLLRRHAETVGLRPNFTILDAGDQKQALRVFPDPMIRKQAEQLLATRGSLPDANREKVLKSLLSLTEQQGDVDAGREMFKKHCAACHKHGEMGKAIGPNLTGMAVHPKSELLTHIIDPSRSVEGNFRIYTVVRADGRVMNGMLASETRTSITLIDTEAKETSIQREDIEELLASRRSLMPEGFEKQMTNEELSNLLEFLTNKGKYVPVLLDRYATAISTKGLFSNGDNGPDRMLFPDWRPKMFNEVPFLVTDPLGKSRPNIILLNGPHGTLPPRMPRSVSLPCNTAARAIHLLSGVGGWNFPASEKGTVSMIVRLHYGDGAFEDHELINGIHFADYIRRVDVPASDFAFELRNQQVRYLAISPKRSASIDTIELIKGSDRSAPSVMAITIESAQ